MSQAEYRKRLRERRTPSLPYNFSRVPREPLNTHRPDKLDREAADPKTLAEINALPAGTPAEQPTDGGDALIAKLHASVAQPAQPIEEPSASCADMPPEPSPVPLPETPAILAAVAGAVVASSAAKAEPPSEGASSAAP